MSLVTDIERLKNDPMADKGMQDIISDYNFMLAQLSSLDLEDVIRGLKVELLGPCRASTIDRLYSRYNKLRRAADKPEIYEWRKRLGSIRTRS